jgi:hypothetical protein
MKCVLEKFASPSTAVVNIVIVTHAVFALGCASNPVPGAFQKEIRARGFTAFNQPVGDPRSVQDWNKFGPGAILRADRQSYYYSAKILIGDDGVQEAMRPQNASPISLFSGKRVSGYDLDGKGGWTVDDVNKIASTIQLKNATNVDLKLGKAWLANPKSEAELHQSLKEVAKNLDKSVRNALRKGKFVVVQNAVFADSVRYYFKQEKKGGGSAVYKLTDQEIANLQANGYKVVNGAIEIDEPRFIAFTPLPDAGEDVYSR